MALESASIVVSPIENGLRVSLIGEISHEAPEIEAAIHQAGESKPEQVEIDLGDATYLSSWAVGLLVWLRNEVGKGGGTVRVTRVRKRVLQTLHYARLESFLNAASAVVVDP